MEKPSNISWAAGNNSGHVKKESSKSIILVNKRNQAGNNGQKVGSLSKYKRGIKGASGRHVELRNGVVTKRHQGAREAQAGNTGERKLCTRDIL